jgi:hypothetical protein
VYHIVYKTVNKTNSKYYIGVHSTENIDDSYLGSGTNILRAIRKYGKNNFERNIISIHTSRDLALKEEYHLVKLALDDELCYNLCEGGGNPPIRTGLTAPAVKLIGDNRTLKQKEAANIHSQRMKNRSAVNRISLTVFGNTYASKAEAKRKLKLSISQLDFYLKTDIQFESVDKMKSYIWNERCKKLSEIKLNGN